MRGLVLRHRPGQQRQKLFGVGGSCHNPSVHSRLVVLLVLLPEVQHIFVSAESDLVVIGVGPLQVPVLLRT